MFKNVKINIILVNISEIDFHNDSEKRLMFSELNSVHF